MNASDANLPSLKERNSFEALLKKNLHDFASSYFSCTAKQKELA